MNMIDFFLYDLTLDFLIYGVILGIIIGIYAFFRIRYALKDSELSKNKKMAINIIIPLFTFIVCLNTWSNATLVTLYLFYSSIIADIIRLIWKYLLKDNYLKIIPKIHKKGLLALIIFVLIMGFSIYGMNHTELTEYNVTTDKFNESYSILFVSDVHYGAVQDKQLVKDSISKMNELNPDVVVLGGDIVEEQTSNSDMKEVFREFGKINSTYGTYFIFGNHETQAFEAMRPNGTRTYSDKELIQAIEESGIKILCDNKTRINNDIVLIGRNDEMICGADGKANTADLIDNEDSSKYLVVLDHRPVDYEENSKAGVDLQISGHTHAGQVFPVSIFRIIDGDLLYGEYEFDDMELIVSSGLGGWGHPLRNQGKCEYVLVNIN